MIQFAGRKALPAGEIWPMQTSLSIYRFGPFDAKSCAQELSKNGTMIRLRGQPFSILELLLTRAGEVVTREEIRQKLWTADTFVDFEHGLNTSIKKLRAALGDSATEPRYIETLPRLGYRFIAPVEIRVEPRPDETVLVKNQTVAEVVAIPEPGPALAGQVFVAAETGRRGPRPQLFMAPVMVLLVGATLAFNVGGTRDRVSSLFRSTRDESVAVASVIPPRSVAVLPLQNLSNDSAEEYFADGITAELTSDLAQFENLQVISRTSAMHYKGVRKTAREIGRELGVGTLIEGTVQRVGNHVRIRVQLIDTATDRHLWARSYDREVKDVLSLQSSAAHDIAAEVQAKLGLP